MQSIRNKNIRRFMFGFTIGLRTKSTKDTKGTFPGWASPLYAWWNSCDLCEFDILGFYRGLISSAFLLPGARNRPAAAAREGVFGVGTSSDRAIFHTQLSPGFLDVRLELN